MLLFCAFMVKRVKPRDGSKVDVFVSYAVARYGLLRGQHEHHRHNSSGVTVEVVIKRKNLTLLNTDVL